MHACRSTLEDPTAILALVRGDDPGRLPLSAAQQGFWLLDSLYPGHAGANEQFAVHLDGPLDRDALDHAWRGVLARHAVLRARFGDDAGVPWQRIAPVPEGPLDFRDVAADPDELTRVAAAAMTRPFDIAAEPLLRPVLLRLGDAAHCLLVTAHHLVADGLSVGIIRDDLAALYEARRAGREADLPPAPRHADFVAAQARRHAGDRLAPHLAWWREQLHGAPARHALPRRAAHAGRPGDARRLAFAIDAEVAAALRALARSRGVTLFTVLLAAFRVLLARYGGEDDVLVSAPVTARDEASTRRMVGCLINNVVFRTSLAGDPSFDELLARERATLLGVLDHREAPFGRVVESLGLPRHSGEQPLSQLLFQFDQARPARAAAGVVFRIEPVLSDRQSYWDIEWSVTDHGDGHGLAGHVSWAVNWFEGWLVEAMPRHFATLLGAVAADPGQRVSALPLLDAAERRRVLVEWNATAAPYPDDATLHGLAKRQCQIAPDSVALRTDAGVVTFAELDARAAGLAAHLASLGVAPGDLVAVSLSPSPHLVTALLGILRAGAAFVPLDPAYPRDRRAFMLRDCGARVLVTESGAAALPGDASVCRVDVDVLATDAPAGDGACAAVSPDSPAYVLYTSGSTGEPKGAIGLHRGAVNRCDWMWREHGFGAADVFCLRTSINFVDSLWEIFGALMHGIPLVIPGADAARDPALLVPALARHGVTQLVLVPPLLRALLDVAPDLGRRLPALRTVITSGEPLPPDLWAAARRALPRVRILNTYGTSEIWDATCCDTSALDGAPERIPIGKAIANVSCYVLDRHLQPVPVGVAGELCIGGVGIGAGYWRRPALTAERFVPDPFGGAPGARLYRSGDLARLLPDGSIECLGRVDRQLKLRGFRLEPAEIEAVLRGCEGVTDAAVLLREEGGDPRLVAWVAADGGRADLARLQEEARRRLPEFMRPSAWVVLPHLPLTPSGKLDRDALPAPPAVARARGARRQPADDVEARLLELWRPVLRVADAGPEDDFFDLGGQSLDAMRLLARAAAAFGVPLTLRDLFDAPTVAALAGRIRALADRAASAEPLAPMARSANLPLSRGQERLWFLDQLDPLSPAYNIAWTIRIDGPLDAGRLQRALDAVVARHESLRSAFPAVGGRPSLQIRPQLSVPIALEDAGGDLAEARRAALARQPFDLARGPLLRATLLALGDGGHELVVVMHHIVTDGTSNGILFREIIACYEALTAGAPASLPPLPVQYADFAAWQRRTPAGRPGGGEPDDGLRYWVERLAGAPAALELPTDFPRPADQRFRGAWVWRSLAGPDAERLREFARGRDCTLYMLMLAAFKALVARYSGQHDLLVGTPVSARPHPDLEPLVGLFINTVVLRTDAGGDPAFDEFLRRVRATAVDAFAHQDVPFEQLVERLRPGRSLSRAPVFQVMFNLVQIPETSRHAGGVDFRLGRLLDHGVSTFDLTLTVGEHRAGLELVFEFDTDLFGRETVERLADAYRVLLDDVLRAPERRLSELALLSRAEAERIAGLLTGERSALAVSETALTIFAGSVAARSGAVAVSAAGERLTYAALDERANRIAHRVSQYGIGRGQRVGVCLGRSCDLPAAILGVLKSGAAFVPLDPDYPAERLRFMARDAELGLVITDAASAVPYLGVPALDLDAEAKRLARQPGTAPAVEVRPGDPAYLVYTSGSTGEAKGAVVTHGSLAATFRGWESAYGLAADDVHLQMASAAFDVFTGDLARALFSGARLVLCPREALLDPVALNDIITRERVTVAEFVPAVIRPLMAWLRRESRVLTGLRLLVVGSDTWYGTEYCALRELCGPGTRVVNSYGVAEATIDSAWFEAPDGDAGPGVVPIGRPFPQVAIRILDQNLAPVPAGVPGELCIGGAGVAQGYWRRPELAAQRFVALADGAMVYRTGDRARLRADGAIEFLGRMDTQVKLRGFRIEPGEIEAALGAVMDVAACAVALKERSPGDARLVAWVAMRPGATAGAQALREALRQKLPAHMVPSVFVQVEALPLTPNGKVDRRALVDGGGREAWEADGAAVAGPRNAVEATLSELYAEVLGRSDDIGIHADFFSLGGHSLLATQLVSRIRDVLEVELPLKTLFERPTVAGLGEAIAQWRPAGLVASGAPPVQRRPATTAPLSYPQQRLWFLDQLEPGNAAYHLHAAYRLRGTLNVEALERAVQAVVARHEALRTTFAARDGEPEQVIHPGIEVPVERMDFHDASEEQVEAEMLRRIEAPFDLGRGPLLRVTLLKTAALDQRLLLVLHHIVTDGWSLAVLLREITQAYNALVKGKTPDVPALPVQYADYAQWQRQFLAGRELGRQLDYWRSQLAGAPSLINLPADRPRPAVQAWRGAWHTLTLPADLGSALTALAQRERATLFMVLLAAFEALLSRYGGDEELAIGTPVAGRSRTELEGLIGFFVNTLVMRGDLRGNPPFRELLARVRRTALDAYAHADVPFEKLVEALDPARSRAWPPLTQVLFAWHNEPRHEPALDGLAVSGEVVASRFAKFDLSLHVAEHDGALVTSFAYNTDLFDRETVEQLAESYGVILAEVARDAEQRIGDLELLGETARASARAERERVALSNVFVEFPESALGSTLTERFAEQVAAHADRLAVSWPSSPDSVGGASAPTPQHWTYADLDRHARSVAAGIISATGEGQGPVALLLGHDGPMIAGLLGVLQSGRAYVPLDPWSPRARNEWVLRDSGACAIVTDESRLGNAPWLRETGLPLILAEHREPSASRRPPPTAADNRAYLLYTSGTTGHPKGVPQAHRNVLGHIRTWTNQLRINTEDRLALFSGYGYDAAVQDLFGALLNGASVHPIDLRGGESAPEIVDRIARERLTLLHATPTVYRYLFGGRVTCEQDLTNVRLVVLGGEEARRSDLDLFKLRFPRGARFVNGLGLTECTMALQYLADHDTRVLGERLPIGRPVPGTAALLLDEEGKPGAWSGELALASPHLTPGYHGDAALTAERFRAHPDDTDERLYLTRDLARRLPDGQLLHAGRRDAQVKIRGIRVEPAEVEAALRAWPEVGECVVGTHEAEPGEMTLVAWVVARGALDQPALRQALRLQLPEYLVPQRFVEMPGLPRLPNGKIDRRALPTDTAAPAPAARPATATEARLVALWRDLLGRDGIGIHDDFFALGGHSLLAMRLVARIRDSFGADVPLATMFEHRTVSALAAYLDGPRAATAGGPSPIPRLSRPPRRER